MSVEFHADETDLVTFDSFGTLVDTGTAARVLDGVVDDPDAVVREWRHNALFYSVVAADLDRYATYSELHRDGLRDALRAVGVDCDEDRASELNEVYHDLDPFADVARGFERLDDAGYRPSILSNGEPELLESLVASAGIGDSVDALVSADEIRTFKPARELYEHAASRVETPPDRIVHVTAHWMDVQGAMNAGMAGGFLARAEKRWPSFGPGPSLTVDSLDELCERLGA